MKAEDGKEKHIDNLKILEKAIYNFPNILLEQPLTNNLFNFILKNYLPYSIGIEIECNSDYGSEFLRNEFLKIKNIMEVSGGDMEIRFRIPNGLNGIICLYDVCKILPKYFTLNLDSGIHYHIDLIKYWIDNDTIKNVIKTHNDYIINELKTWKTADETDIINTVCKLDMRCWCNFQSEFKTMEIRIGEMTFDYNIMISRIIHGCNIVKNIFNDDYLAMKKIKIDDALKKLDSQLNSLNNRIDYIELIKKRTVKI